MNQTETRLIEEGWAALVERLGVAEATRFVMLLDRRTGGAINHLNYIQSGTLSGGVRRSHGQGSYGGDDATSAGTESWYG